ncbi:MAG: hypothetical protein GY866_32550 [Proteobacteria bacterium]|nr:hypothetical protein [Pseudomonadota bacterium]
MSQLVVNLKRHYDSEKKAGPTVDTKNPVGRVAEGLGVGEVTVKRIMARYNRNGQRVASNPPKPRGKPAYRVAVNLQPVIREYIRSRNLEGQRVGVEKVRTFLLERYQAEISVPTLWRSLKRWGFVHGTGKRRSALKEREYVVLARRKYLRTKRANRNPDGTLKRPEVYLDETFVNKNHSSRFTWYLNEDGPWVNKPSGKGPRFIIVHAVTKDGWVDGAELVFQAKKRTGDYHGQMNWDNFSKWFVDQLLPNIPPNSIIVLDNAKYHNVLVDEAFPTSKTRKQQMREWLTRNGYPWTEDMLKSELFELCKRVAPKPEFKLDKLVEPYGHTILRTPQYHPELQPIETCWAVVKNHLADNCDFTMENLKKILPVAFSKVTPSTCRKLIAKVVEQEDRFWQEDGEIEKAKTEDEEVLNYKEDEYETFEEYGEFDEI